MVSFIGCSGYYYREWKGQFYPSDLPSTKWLRFYTEHFNTIEINATFYRKPSLKGLRKWYTETPDGFVFTVKANKLFTHYRRMKNIAEYQAEFYGTCTEALQEKLHCMLYQFPATVKYSDEMLAAILTLSDLPILHAIEFRDISWWREDVYAALQAAGIVFVNVSFPTMEDIFVPDDSTNYLRFHGKPILFKSGYGVEGLLAWANEVKRHPPGQLIAYFNNTWFSEAITDARLFRQMLATP